MINLDVKKNNTILIMSGTEEEGEDGLATATINKPKRPPRYKVLLHNDDFTTMEFVVMILKKHFNKTLDEANAIMLKVHHDGIGICGVYTREVAETKVEKVKNEAKQNGFPLLCTFEPNE
jgi:ATP-dependent Clp protease adaptor protein ClpS